MNTSDLSRWEVPDGTHLIDMSVPPTDKAWYRSIATETEWKPEGILMDMMGKSPVTAATEALEAGMGVAFYQGYDPQAFTDVAQAQARAELMLRACELATLRKRTHVFLDWESVPTTVPEPNAITWINRWSYVIQQAGYLPGVYVGPGQPLTGRDFTHLPNVHLFWAWLDITPPIPEIGYAIQQRESAKYLGYYLDNDIAVGDRRGQKLMMTKYQNKLSPTAPTTPGADPIGKITSQLSATMADVAVLKSQMAAIHQATD